MKNYIFFLIMLTPLLNFAQLYEFNLLTNYKSENGFYDENIVYSNKYNDSYFLKVSKYDKTYVAKIVDLKNSKYHFFEVIERKEINNETSYKFVHKSSANITYRDISRAFDFEIVKKDSLYKTVKLITYKNKRKKTILGTAELKIKNAPYNLFALFRYSCLHPFEEFKILSFNENGIVESYKSLETKNSIYIYLDSYSEKVNFEVKVTPKI